MYLDPRVELQLAEMLSVDVAVLSWNEICSWVNDQDNIAGSADVSWIVADAFKDGGVPRNSEDATIFPEYPWLMVKLG